MLKSILKSFAVAAVAASVAQAHAGTVTYNSQAAFNAATTGVTSYNIPAPAGVLQLVSSPYTISPLTFSVRSDESLFLANDGVYGAGQTYLEAFAYSGPASENIALAGASALGFTVGTFFGADTVSVDVNGVLASTFSTPGGSPDSVFFGVTDTTPITSLSFSILRPEIDILNFQVGSLGSPSPSPVPEPSSLVLLGTGILAALGASGTLRSKLLRA